MEDKKETNVNLSVLTLISEARLTFGLRHQDYTRYRKYCTRKITSLRRALGLLKKGGPIKNDEKSDELKTLKNNLNVFSEDKRYFELILFLCERAWSYGMEIKMGLAEDPRKKNHLLSRFRKASKVAMFLDLISHDKGFALDKVLEIKAYTTLINGYYYFEKEEWETSLEYFNSSKVILENLVQSESTLAKDEALYFSIIDEIEPNIRFCFYNLEKEMDDLIIEEYNEKLLTKVYETHLKQVSPQLKSLNVKSDLPKKVDIIEWFGHSIQLRGSEITRLIIAAKEAEEELFNNPNINKEDAMGLYDKMISSYSDATQIAHKLCEEDKKASESIQSSKSAQLSGNLNLLKACVQQRHFNSMISRNLFLINENYIIDSKSNCPQLIVTGKVEDIIRLLEGIKQILVNITNIPFFQEEYEFEQWIKARMYYFKGVSQVFMGLCYLNEHKYIEAISLFEHSSSSFAQFIAFNHESVQSNYELDNLISLDSAMNFEKVIKSLYQQSQTMWATVSENETKMVTDSLSKLNLKYNQIVLTICQRLDQFPNFKLDNNNEKGKQFIPEISNLPGKVIPVPCKSMVFDLAFNKFEDENCLLYAHLNKLSGRPGPQEQVEIEEDANNGMLGNLFSYFKK